ncbi:MAG: ABC transporter ATP-binding protein [Actinobacteria bacterium]|nr:ABC transporter ATP-binding protein [Actinomycetota bacterium]
MSSDASVEVRRLSKSFTIDRTRSLSPSLREAVGRRARHPFARRAKETVHALSDVSFDVAAGEALGIIGRNGAGKSTLLKILSRITRPSGGVVRLRGRVGSLLEVGTGFHPELTGRENIYLNGAILGMSRRDIRRRFDEIVAFAETERFLDTPVKRYSSGMYVRLAFAVAAHLETEILIVDEVLAVGDADFQRKCLGEMEGLRQQGRTLLFVSHNLVAIESVCHRAIYLEQGRVAFDGRADDAVSTYISRSEREGQRASRGRFDRTQTPEDGAIRITGVELRRNGKSLTDSLRLGDSLQVTVLGDRLVGKRLALGLRLRDESRQRLAGVSTAMRPPKGRSRSSDLVAFHLRRLTLTPGRYWLDVGLIDSRSGDYLDLFEGAATFDVEATDFYGSGFRVTHAEGPILLEFEWS